MQAELWRCGERSERGPLPNMKAYRLKPGQIPLEIKTNRHKGVALYHTHGIASFQLPFVYH